MSRDLKAKVFFVSSSTDSALVATVKKKKKSKETQQTVLNTGCRGVPRNIVNENAGRRPDVLLKFPAPRI